MNHRTRIMAVTLFISVVLTGIKFLAWGLTHSNAILTDAMESIVNVTAGAFALVSISIASQPKDENHPYGHGKIEFISAGFEGALILIAGGIMTGKGIYGFFHPSPVERLDAGLWLTAAAGACNGLMGWFLLNKGRKMHSLLMIADGKHLLSDTYSSAGLVVGLLILHFTGIGWIDNLLAVVFGLLIIFTGYRIVREALGNLLDEADHEKLNMLIEILNRHRRPIWIDMHNLRVLRYGPQLHVDAHITLPWYASLEEAHTEVDAVEQLVRSEFENEIEFFIHADPCLPKSCPICSVENCPKRSSPHEKKIEWNLENMLPDRKHTIQS